MTCTHVVHATNAYASALLPQLSGRTGIVPTRGQAISIRAAVPAHELTLSGFTTNYGREYWFVRPGTAVDERPLVILGGARLTEGSSRSATTDDSVLDGAVGRRLREFLPELFPEKFEKGAEPEMEWVRVVLYYSILPAMLIVLCRGLIIVCHNRQVSWALPNSGIHLCVPISYFPDHAIYTMASFPVSGHRLDRFWTNLNLGAYRLRVSTSLPDTRVMACHAPSAGPYFLSYLSTPDDQRLQCGHRGTHDRVQDYGSTVGATVLAPTTLSYDLGRLATGVVHRGPVGADHREAPHKKWVACSSPPLIPLS
jgi:hypothetical protein